MQAENVMQFPRIPYPPTGAYFGEHALKATIEARLASLPATAYTCRCYVTIDSYRAYQQSEGCAPIKASGVVHAVLDGDVAVDRAFLGRLMTQPERRSNTLQVAMRRQRNFPAAFTQVFLGALNGATVFVAPEERKRITQQMFAAIRASTDLEAVAAEYVRKAINARYPAPERYLQLIDILHRHVPSLRKNIRRRAL